MQDKYYESDLIDFIYDKLFENTKNENIDFCNTFPDASVMREFAHIVLNNEYVITVSKI